MNIHDLGNKVRAQMHDPQHEAVFLRCDETVPFGTFATVIDTLRQSGIENVSIVTEPLSDRRKRNDMSAVAYKSTTGLKAPLLGRPRFMRAVWVAGRLHAAFPSRRLLGRPGGGGAISVKLVVGGVRAACRCRAPRR